MNVECSAQNIYEFIKKMIEKYQVNTTQYNVIKE